MQTPGLGRQTVYGVWGTSGDDFYAVGSAGGRNGFIWHYHDGAFENESCPLDLPRIAERRAPRASSRSSGSGDDVWVVGAGGASCTARAPGRSSSCPRRRRTRSSPCTATGDRLLAVGGASNGVVLDGSRGRFHDASPAGAGLIQGVFATRRAATGRAASAGSSTRAAPGAAAFAPVDHGLALAARRRRSTRSSSTRRAASGPPAATCSRPRSTAECSFTTAIRAAGRASTTTTTPSRRRRADAGRPASARPPSSPRARTDRSRGAGTSRRSPRSGSTSRGRRCTRATCSTCPPRCGTRGRDTTRRPRASSCASGTRRDRRRRGAARRHQLRGVRRSRASLPAGGRRQPTTRRVPARGDGATSATTRTTRTTRATIRSRSATASGTRSSRRPRDDGANEANDYADPTGYEADEPAARLRQPGRAARTSPSDGSRINLSVAATQNGIILPAGVQTYIGAQWGGVFAVRDEAHVDARAVARPRAAARASARR